MRTWIKEVGKRTIVWMMVLIMLASSVPYQVYGDETTDTVNSDMVTSSPEIAATETELVEPEPVVTETELVEPEPVVTETEIAELEPVVTETEVPVQVEALPQTPEMPAGSFVGGASNGVSVVATVNEGVFPIGTTMSVTPIAESDAIQIISPAVSEITDVVAVDITFYDAAGNEIEPADRTQVNVMLSSAEAVEGDEHAVVHVSSNGPQIIADANSLGASFNTDSFSIYAIIGQPNGQATITYEFYSDASNPVLLLSTIVKNADVLADPGTPVSSVDSTLSFIGWSTSTQPNEYLTFGSAVSIPSGTGADITVKYFARFQDAVNQLNIYNQYGTVMKSISADAGTQVTVADYVSKIVISLASSEKLYGWSTINAPSGTMTGLGDETGEVSSITLSGIVNLYPIIKSGYWITYESNGGTTLARTFYPLYEETVAPSVPQNTGYQFEGWYSDSNFVDEFTFGSSIESDLILYAKWTPETVSYTIKYWTEELDDNNHYVAGNYVLREEEEVLSTAGSVVSIDETNVGAYYKYYTFDHGDQDVVIAGDGSTVVNEYFRLNTYSFTFKVNDITSGTASRITTMEINGVTYSEATPYTFTAHFGESVADRWPTLDYMTTIVTGTAAPMFYKWIRSDGVINIVPLTPYITEKQVLDPTDNSNTVFTAQFSKNLKLYETNYWFENANDTGFTRSEDYSFKSYDYDYLYPEDWTAAYLDGFTYSFYFTPDGYPESELYTNHFYFVRDTYDLSFYSVGNLDQSVAGIKFGASLASYNYVPTEPDSLPKGSTFDGWYTTEDFEAGTEFDLTLSDMPIKDLSLFAKWNPPVYNVTFDLNGGTSEEIADQLDVYGKLLALVSAPTRTGYLFSGWTLNGVEFSFDTLISGDILMYAVDGLLTLQAQWSSNEKYLIQYDAGVGSNAPVDSGTYYENTSALVKSASTPPSNGYFKYWMINGTIYYPGDLLTVTAADATEGILLLTAVYTYGELPTSLYYEPNGGSGTTYRTAEIPNNGAVTVLDISNTLLNYTRAGYTFTGWNTLADGSGTAFAAGAILRMDNIGTNVLYAQWQEVPVVTTYTVTFDSMGGSAVTSITGLLYGALVTEPADPNYKGYKFSGWYQDASYTDKWNFASETITGDMVLYAKWTKVKSTTATVTTTTTVTTTSSSGSASSIPQTSDSTNMIIWIILILLSGFGLFCTYVYRRKRTDLK
ncbi:MAG: InlB B-repeat-containing protein [Lachnospiraceae bacterium]